MNPIINQILQLINTEDNNIISAVKKTIWESSYEGIENFIKRVQIASKNSERYSYRYHDSELVILNDSVVLKHDIWIIVMLFKDDTEFVEFVGSRNSSGGLYIDFKVPYSTNFKTSVIPA